MSELLLEGGRSQLSKMSSEKSISPHPMISTQKHDRLSQNAAPYEVLVTLRPRTAVPLADISLCRAGTNVATSMKKLTRAKRHERNEKMGRMM